MTDKKNADHLYQLGLRCEKGDGVQQDIKKAAEYFQQAADAGLTEAEYRYGLFRYRGEGVLLDAKDASLYFQKAAEKGHAQSAFQLGKMLEFGIGTKADAEKASLHYLAAAKKGLPEAQVELARRYVTGDGLPPSHEEAMSWLAKAKEQGNNTAGELLDRLEADMEGESRYHYYQRQALAGELVATFRLGLTHLQGFEGPVNKQLGFELIQRAANHGYAEAQYLLGQLFMDGKIIQRDVLQAARCFTDAAEAGLPAAHLWLGRIFNSYALRLGFQLNKDDALPHYLEAALASSAEALDQYGFLTFEGTPKRKGDPLNGLRWQARAALQIPPLEDTVDAGYKKRAVLKEDPEGLSLWNEAKETQRELRSLHQAGVLFWQGRSGKKDPKSAAECFEKAADWGFAPSETYLGIMYMQGLGLPLDQQKARLYLTRAARRGDPNAQNALALLHRNGDGAPVDRALGTLWAIRAEEKLLGLLPEMDFV